MQGRRRETSRDPAEEHRGATPLELFYDLTFVVAIVEVTSGFEQGLVAGHVGRIVLAYLVVFFAIWWAWMNFTWYASAYDTDDTGYRIAVFVQMAGVLILGAGVGRGLQGWDFTVMVAGYVVMRISMVALWLRAAATDEQRRTTAYRYAAGITVIQCAWIGWLALPREIALPLFVVLAACELAVPLWAESASRTPWHPLHIAERYGLFTIIVLGEALLGATSGVRAAIAQHATFSELAATALGGLLIVFSMWWFYFDMPTEQVIVRVQRVFADRLGGAFTWGYGHYVVFASAAAVGAGLDATIAKVTGHTQLSHFATGLTVTVPIAVYVIVVWALHVRHSPGTAVRSFAAPVTALLVLASSASPTPVLWSGLLLVALVAVNTLARERAEPGSTNAAST